MTRFFSWLVALACIGVVGCGSGTSNGATDQRETAAPRSAGGAVVLGATPGRVDVVNAMGAITDAIHACGDGAGRGELLLQFAVVSDGSVTEVALREGRMGDGTAVAGTAIESCVVAVGRTARLPPFRNPTFSFTFPFHL